MNRKLSVGVSVALIFVAITITFSVTMVFSMRLFDEKVLNVKERAAMYNKLSEIDDIVRSNLYFDLDEQRLYDSIARGYIEGIGDRDSVYLSAMQIQRRAETMKGMEVTIGFETEKNAAGYITVVNLRKGSSAAELGLLEDDVIVRISGVDVLENGYDKSLGLLMGVAGTRVELTYVRDGEETTIEVARELIETVAIYHSKDIEGIGYIRFKLFNDNTEAQFNAALNTMLVSDEVRGLVFDLRDVYGGYNLESIANMLNRLVPTGAIISGTYADGVTKTLYTADERGIQLPVVVLINENTVGFAELFAGVLADQENCKTVGMPTAGKGTLQQLSMLTDGSGLDLTVAIFATPVSGSFDRTGIKPDYEVTPDDYIFIDSLPDERLDLQLRKAVEVLNSMLL